MGLISTGRWKSLERSSATAFLIAGLIFLVNAAIVTAGIVTADEHLILTLGQAFVGAGWTAAFIGALGLYPGLADRSRWLARIGAAFVAIGAVNFAAMSIASLLYYVRIPSGELGSIIAVFLPGVFVGSVLGFIVLGVASLRTDVRPRSVGVLLLVLPLIVVTNIASGVVFEIETRVFTLGIVVALVLVNVAIGYLLRNGSATADREAMTTPSDIKS